MLSIGDTVTVEIEVQEMLGGFIGMLTANNKKTKRLWIDQVLQFGEPWKKLVNLLAEEGRCLSLVLGTQSDHKMAQLLIS